MKKITKVFSAFIAALLFTSVIVLSSTTEKAYAGSAPGVTYFEVGGFANRAFYNRNRGCIPIQYINQIKVSGPNICFLYKQVGYGNVKFSIDGGAPINGRLIDEYTYTNNGSAYAWQRVEEISLTPGTHLVEAICTNIGTGGSTQRETVQITVT